MRTRIRLIMLSLYLLYSAEALDTCKEMIECKDDFRNN